MDLVSCRLCVFVPFDQSLRGRLIDKRCDLRAADPVNRHGFREGTCTCRSFCDDFVHISGSVGIGFCVCESQGIPARNRFDLYSAAVDEVTVGISGFCPFQLNGIRAVDCLKARNRCREDGDPKGFSGFDKVICPG